MHVGLAITGDACASTVAGVSGHSGASNGSGATYIDHNTSQTFGKLNGTVRLQSKVLACVNAPILQVDGVEALKACDACGLGYHR